MQRSNQLSVENRINENTMVRELINVDKDCHCVTYDWRKIMAVI